MWAHFGLGASYKGKASSDKETHLQHNNLNLPQTYSRDPQTYSYTYVCICICHMAQHPISPHYVHTCVFIELLQITISLCMHPTGNAVCTHHVCACVCMCVCVCACVRACVRARHLDTPHNELSTVQTKPCNAVDSVSFTPDVHSMPIHLIMIWKSPTITTQLTQH